jgi:hypothetical protein
MTEKAFKVVFEVMVYSTNTDNAITIARNLITEYNEDDVTATPEE